MAKKQIKSSEEFEKLWQTIENDFQWKNVRKVMKLLKITWDSEEKSPKIEQLKERAYSLARDAYYFDLQFSQGCLSAYYIKGRLTVSFIPEFKRAEIS